ncbi:hypothetical protein NDU88_003798 [Pleurodeles waltl]|uniref:Uncharacterized protein n=1 Tax=Pleurodeles waltl TaxID=8319 RepID=A0AAV7MVM3_PLEWA|nr:hypothetical protein NDU88_003798 [Pleurodeles waltl]
MEASGRRVPLGRWSSIGRTDCCPGVPRRARGIRCPPARITGAPRPISSGGLRLRGPSSLLLVTPALLLRSRSPRRSRRGFGAPQPQGAAGGWSSEVGVRPRSAVKARQDPGARTPGPIAHYVAARSAVSRGFRGRRFPARDSLCLLPSGVALPPVGEQKVGLPVSSPAGHGASINFGARQLRSRPLCPLTSRAVVCQASSRAQQKDAALPGVALASPRRSGLIRCLLARRHWPQGGPRLGRGPFLGSAPPLDGYRHLQAPDFELQASEGTEAPRVLVGTEAGSYAVVDFDG